MTWWKTEQENYMLNINFIYFVIPSTDVIQLTLTLKMTITGCWNINHCQQQSYSRLQSLDNHAPHTYEMIPGFTLFAVLTRYCIPSIWQHSHDFELHVAYNL